MGLTAAALLLAVLLWAFLGLGGVACIFVGGYETFIFVGGLVDLSRLGFLLGLVVIRSVVVCFAESYIEGDRAVL